MGQTSVDYIKAYLLLFVVGVYHVASRGLHAHLFFTPYFLYPSALLPVCLFPTPATQRVVVAQSLVEHSAVRCVRREKDDIFVYTSYVITVRVHDIRHVTDST